MRQMISKFKKHFALRLLLMAMFISANALTTATAAPGASIQSIAPSSGPVNGGTEVTITGQGFDPTSAVFVDWVLVTFTVDSPTQITLTTPPTSSAKTVDIYVFASAGTVSGSFTYADAAPVETTNPELIVSVPSSKTTVVTQSSHILALSGSASDDSGIARVEVLYNNSIIEATLHNTSRPVITKWTADIVPSEGPVELTVRAYDSNGNFTSQIRRFQFVRRYILSVSRTGPLETRAQPDLAGRVTLTAPRGTYSSLAPAQVSPQTATVTAGTEITLTATAAPGYIFNEWYIPDYIPQLQNISYSLSGRAITFTMPAENISGIRADFIANPFLGLGSRATLVGRLTPAEDSVSLNSTHGLIQANLTTASGSLSGYVLHDGRKTSFTGQVNGNGSVWFKVSGSMSPQLSLSQSRILSGNFAAGVLNVEIKNAGQVSMNGTAKATATTAAAALLNKGTQGYYTVALPSLTPAEQELPASAYPQGAGYGSLKLKNSGIVTAVLRLADGSAATMSGRLIKNSTEVPFYVQTRTPGTVKNLGGSLNGQFTLDPATPAELSSDGLIWFRPAVAELNGASQRAKETQIYTLGWEDGIVVDFIGGHYDGSKTAAVALDLDAPVLTLSGGKLAETLEYTDFSIVGNKVVSNPTDRSYTVSFMQSTGVVVGTFKSGGQKAKAIKGTLITTGRFAGVWGYFLSEVAGDRDPVSGLVRLFEERAPQ
jgi:hypothetical protein